MTNRQFLILIMFIVFAIGSAYLLAVGAVWVFAWLINAGFKTNFDLNVWVVGLLVWLIVGTYAGIKNLINKK